MNQLGISIANKKASIKLLATGERTLERADSLLEDLEIGAIGLPDLKAKATAARTALRQVSDLLTKEAQP